MYFSFFKLTAIASIMVSVLAGPLSEASFEEKWAALKQRDLRGKSIEEINSMLGRRACENIPFTISECNSCGVTGTTPSCQIGAYMHKGISGNNCGDVLVALDDRSNYCKAEDDIPTPIGKGKWETAAGCDTANPDGAAASVVKVGDRVCTCKNKRSINNFYCFPVNFACTQLFECNCC